MDTGMHVLHDGSEAGDSLRTLAHLFGLARKARNPDDFTVAVAQRDFAGQHHVRRAFVLRRVLNAIHHRLPGLHHFLVVTHVLDGSFREEVVISLAQGVALGLYAAVFIPERTQSYETSFAVLD